MKRMRSVPILPQPAKRQRVQHVVTGRELEDDPAEEADFAALFSVSDTQAYMELLRREARQYKLPYPFLLLSQLYGAMGSHTQVDRDLDGLVERGEVRTFEILREKDDSLVVFVEDWIDTIAAAKLDYLQGIASLARQNAQEDREATKPRPRMHQERRAAAVPKKSSADVFDLFAERVVPCYHEPTITTDKLLELLCGPDQRRITSHDITPLVNAGLVLFRDTSLYGLSIPGVGPFVIHCHKGREELLRVIRKSPFEQISVEKLNARKCRTSKLPWRFHIHSALGLQLIEKVESPDGMILRIAA
eukprot:TRINITY_DN6096_c0_g1_i1.p1 TRINITY_DN6096_c0_g1~~TRINITY_DN6096_c0_g1_i1.p1  ORF type:complete len:304 (+),score=55.66 TRINITY_DN6096_c0_g1_i1:127-1038(+)